MARLAQVEWQRRQLVGAVGRSAVSGSVSGTVFWELGLVGSGGHAILRRVIRRAELSDLDALVDVHLAAFRAGNGPYVDADALGELTRERDAEAWRPVIEQLPSAAVLQVAEESDRIIGLSGAGSSRDDDGSGVGELYAIYVDPERWDDGTASALEAAARDHLRAQGFREATLWTVAANARARRFYERCGWQHDGSSKELMGTTAVRYRTPL